MSDSSARLGLPYLAAGQMQKHVTLNEALTRLDGLVQCQVVSRTMTTQPDGVDDGSLYILPEGATGERWSLYPVGTLMRAEGGGWTAVPVPPGLIAVVEDAEEIVVRRDGSWTPLAALIDALQDLDRLGIGATADAANPFLAKLNSALWTARESGDGGTGDLRLVLNKAGPGQVLSLILQSAWSGRAELGLIGEDQFGLKVSADGSTWREALKVDPADGRVRFPQGATRREALLFTEDAVWSPPEWARWVEATIVGGGGGGAAGTSGPAGTERVGGGGGGGGGQSHAVWSVDGLPGALDLTVGTGGAESADGGMTRILSDGVQLLAAGGGQGGMSGTAGDGLQAAAGSGGMGGSLTAADALVAAVAGGSGNVLRRPAQGGAAGSAGEAIVEPIHGLCGGGGGGGSASLSSGQGGGAGGHYGASALAGREG
ncbi:DUF2793 domain-containing protein, partial [Brevundimonas sp. A19_0]|uniref:DUF2793 domain-containing protein n=1 Tax=Brevundimonas sp. A19_0 TaxID=2821087 RepID=UPI001ADD52BD